MTLKTEQEYKNKIAALEAEIEKLKKKETQKIKNIKYGLNWIDVPEAFEEESKDSIPILEEVKEKAIKNDDGKPTHILIEGDNFHALTCLNYTHAGKIDVIYIDPPYNTGDKKGGKFVYRDNRFLEEYPDGRTILKDDPLRHSAWLSFMNKRLKLAKSLLKETGIICISIDDYEQSNLKLLCNQIFGETNFINQFIWKRNSSGKTEVDKFTVNTEYVLLYRKSERCKLNAAYKPLAEASIKLYKYDDNDGRGKYQTVSLQKPQDPGPETTYDYIDNNGKCWKCPPKGWRMIYSKIKDLENDNRLVLTGASLRVKDYWNERDNEGKRIDTLWDDLPENTSGTSQLSELFDNKVIFSNPKPAELIRRCLQISNNKAITLDFFAGSGTTMHSTMKLNDEDNGCRQCILIQTKESIYEIKDGVEVPKEGAKIAFDEGYRYISDITYERNRRAIQGYTNSKGEKIPGLGNSLKYYRTAFVGKNPAQSATDEDRISLSQKAGSLISLSENTLEEIKTTDFYQIFSDGKKYTAIYFSEDLSEFYDFVKEVESKNSKVSVFIFSWGSPDIFENEFNNLKNITIKAIPKPILEIYKSLNGGL